ncbi:polysaccharide biosynthesis tyrosine autokinase [Actinoplanes sp. NPDC049118]|uniref:polysaccharide biosynthesis tyrosine autokinase n=1 Tax=Actinoplanes sp. NPDC049118 TaxID=3155769 RepID=UPI0033CB3E9F
MELREYVRACRRRWVWIVVPVLLATGVAAGLTLTGKPAYRSSMILFVTTGAGDPDAKASRLNSYIALLTGPRVAESVVKELGPDLSATQVQKSLSAQVQEGTDLLVVSATDSSAERSESIVTTATAILIGLARQLDPPNSAGDGPRPSVSIAQNPVTVRQPGNLVRNIGFSAVLGLLIGAAAVAVREATRKTVNDEDDLRRLGLGTVGVISIGGRSRRDGSPDEALAEAFRRLRSLLPDISGFKRPGARGTSLLLTGPHEKEGTTAVACGLAIAMAETGARVVLVDANLRAPGLGRYLSLDTSRGLADVLTGRARVPDVLQDSLDGRLTVLPSGDPAPDPGEILASPTLGATLRHLTERFDIVLVDAPPLHGVADAAVLGKVTDSALLVVRANRTRTADVERSTDLLQRVGARLAGAVLNALPRKLPTGGTWHREDPLPQPHDPELMSRLLGDDNAPDEGVATDETVIFPAYSGPVRGRARVVKATIGAAEEEPKKAEPVPEPALEAAPAPEPAPESTPEPVPEDAGAAGAARGQARVIVNDVPAAGDRAEQPKLPTQRGTDDKQQPGE